MEKTEGLGWLWLALAFEGDIGVFGSTPACRMRLRSGWFRNLDIRCAATSISASGLDCACSANEKRLGFQALV